MKSVIQEGSTLAKAIEEGWIKAGKPREFTIKIFQEPKKNFFGMTTTAAKIGIFFKEAYEASESRPERKNVQQKQRGQPHQHRPQERYNQPRKRFVNKEKTYSSPKPKDESNNNNNNKE